MVCSVCHQDAALVNSMFDISFGDHTLGVVVGMQGLVGGRKT